MAHRPPGSIRLRPGLWPAGLPVVWPFPAAGLRAWLLGQVLEERERWILWLPVAIGTGIAIYFALPVEPPLWPGPAIVLCALLMLAWQWRRRAQHAWPPLFPWLIALLALGGGFTAAQLRTIEVAAPVLERRNAHILEGRILLVEDRVRGQRLLLGQPSIEGLSPNSAPARVRISVRTSDPELRPGDLVRVRALLMPPSAPAAPGDFDFARYAFFERVGAVGYALGDLERISAAEGLGLQYQLAGVRQHLASEISAALPGTTGAVGNALLTGFRAAIPDPVWLDMQASGLAHLLSISGLHLSMVAGTIFFAARIGIALAPPLALRLPGKKLAAAIALLGAFGYLLISGAPVPTLRAAIMTGLALIAIMVDRNPFSMRLIAFAAFLVLLFQPESLLGASFQMSFAAVVALIAAYETGLGRRPEGARGLDWRLIMYVLGVALTTVIASFATAPFAVYHFNRLPTYGVVANLIAVPLTAFWIMPLGLLGLLLVPFGLGASCFVLMGYGIDVVLAVAAAVADLPGASLAASSLPLAALVALVLGGLWLCLWQRPWRRLGLLGVPLALLVVLFHRPPDLLVEKRGHLMALRRADGGVSLSPWDRDAWVTDGWLGRFGETQATPWPEEGVDSGSDLRCDALGCVVTTATHRIALARRPEALLDDCRRADLVISYPRTERCRTGAPLIGPEALWRSGGLALWFDPKGIRTLSVREDRGERPWAP